MGHAGSCGCQAVYLGPRYVDRVHGEQRGIQQAEFVEALDRALARGFDRCRHFRLRFVQVYLHRHIELIGENAKLRERVVG